MGTVMVLLPAGVVNSMVAVFVWPVGARFQSMLSQSRCSMAKVPNVGLSRTHGAKVWPTTDFPFASVVQIHEALALGIDAQVGQGFGRAAFEGNAQGPPN